LFIYFYNFYIISSTKRLLRHLHDSETLESPCSGIYEISVGPPGNPKPIYVYCDLEDDGGGWTVSVTKLSANLKYALLS